MNSPISTLHLFPKLDQKLIELLRSLSPEDWQKRTLAPLWTVHDIALHLLDGNIRSLSMLRDSYFGVKPGEINDYSDLVRFLNQLNADWVQAMKRVSPEVLIDLLEHTGKQYIELLESLDPFATASFSVAWAGEEQSQNWFHIAREYTEKWHHQQQIRYAVGQTASLYEKELYLPYLETSMRALPYHYRDIKAPKNDTIAFVIKTESDPVWHLRFNGKEWELVNPGVHSLVCTITIDGETAWRIFTKGISKQEAAENVTIGGRRDLGEKILDMLAVMA